MKKTNKMTLIASATVALAFTHLAHAQEKQVEMKFGFWVPAQHSLAKTSIEPWAKSVEAASKGSIKVSLFPAQQLGKAADHYDMARDGIAEITWVSPGYQASRFPIFSASELPFLISQPGQGSAAVDAWYRKHAEKEMKDVKYCFAHIHIGTLHSKKAITDPAQIKGMKIRPANGTVAQTMVSLGASNVQVSAPESRDALDKGVADAITFPWDSLISFNIDKAVKFHLDAKLYAASFVWVINKPWFDGLSTTQKKVINDHCNNEWATKVGEGWGGAEDSGEAKLAATAGHTIVKLTPEQVQTWKKAVEPVTLQWSQTAQKAGANPTEVLNDLKRELTNRKAAY
ncbi:TRAP transporter substrate-binding protein [Hydrogenophaga sp. OTU3427]|jgi:TRAP-type C4-dicarboxylate transport system substrate-binding protein|uniref:TRAP transporter substrate-binding protein n=1 Tax=Hydrogenophaga sp. OTU3427 TaxID=3043856 RepID=UPI00313B6D7D